MFKDESLDEAFARYDVDGSGFLDFGEASVALADMGALEGVLASKAGELFDRFDVDGDGQVDLDEFRELAQKVRDLRGSVSSKPTPEVPEGFIESAAALPLRKSFEAFAAFGKGPRSGEAVEHINGRDWSKLVKDCGLVGGSVNSAASDIIFARAVPKGQRVLRWEDGSFLIALAMIAAEHRVTFGQVAQRVSQCAPNIVDREKVESAGSGASERAAAAAARAAYESANGTAPGPDATSKAALRSIFAQYAKGQSSSSKSNNLGHLSALDALHALSDVGALRRQSPILCLQLVTRAVDESLGSAPDGSVSFDAFERCASSLVSNRSVNRTGYKPPDDVHLPLNMRKALRLSFEVFSNGSQYGIKPEQWETCVRACGLVGAKCTETTAGVIFAKCKAGAGSMSAAPKVITFEGFVQACAHVASEYAVKFDVVAQRVLKCTPKDGEDLSAKKPPKSPVKPKYIEPRGTAGGGGGKVAVVPPSDPTAEKSHGTEVTATNVASHTASGLGRGSVDISPEQPESPTRSSARSSKASSVSDSVRAPLAPPKEIPLTYRASDSELRSAFATFADPPSDSGGDKGGEFSLAVPSCDAVKWGQIIRVCNLVGGSLTTSVAREIFRASGAPVSEDGRMRYDEFLWACATVAGTHGVQFREVANRLVGVANKHTQIQKERKEASAGAGEKKVEKNALADEKTKKKGMFSRIF